MCLRLSCPIKRSRAFAAGPIGLNERREGPTTLEDQGVPSSPDPRPRCVPGLVRVPRL